MQGVCVGGQVLIKHPRRIHVPVAGAHLPVQHETVLVMITPVAEVSLGHQRHINVFQRDGSKFRIIDDVAAIILVGPNRAHHHPDIIKLHLVPGIIGPVKHVLVGFELQFPVIDRPDPYIGLLPGVGYTINIFVDLIKNEFNAVTGHDIDDQPRVGRRNILRSQSVGDDEQE